jgi:hypothetical protein
VEKPIDADERLTFDQVTILSGAPSSIGGLPKSGQTAISLSAVRS